jgi:alpha-ketoglutarate-dependent taurine dioxygenase
VEIPSSGGDTLFPNMYTAFEQLSPGLQKLLSGLNALNDADKSEAAQTRFNRIADSTNPLPQKNLKATGFSITCSRYSHDQNTVVVFSGGKGVWHSGTTVRVSTIH